MDSYYDGAAKVPSEIQNIKDTIVFGLDKRQLLFTAIAISAAGIIYFVFYKWLALPSFISLLIMALAALGIGSFGFLKPMGLPIEQFFLVWRSNNIVSAPTRTLFADNAYDIPASNLPSGKKHKRDKRRKKQKSAYKFVQ